MRLSVRGSATPRIGSIRIAVEKRDRQPPDRVLVGHVLALEPQPIPAAADEHAELRAQLPDVIGGATRSDCEARADLGQQLVGRAAVEVADDAVVVEDASIS